jgi:PPOX class probable F420-dependent enzyme
MSQLSMSREQREAFLADVHVGVLAVAPPDGPPALTPVWYRYRESVVEIVTTAQTRKVGLLREAGHASLCVQTEQFPPAYVTVEGAVDLSPATPDMVEDIAVRYLGAEAAATYMETAHDDTLITLRPEHWRTADFSKVAPA